jgi:hypothetical protein
MAERAPPPVGAAGGVLGSAIARESDRVTAAGPARAGPGLGRPVERSLPTQAVATVAESSSILSLSFDFVPVFSGVHCWCIIVLPMNY